MNRVNAKVYRKIGRNPWERLPAFTWPGCYTLVYYAKDYSEFCAKCAENSDTNERIIDVDVYWEGDPLECAHCGCKIESSYGPVEEEAAQ